MKEQGENHCTLKLNTFNAQNSYLAVGGILVENTLKDGICVLYEVHMKQSLTSCAYLFLCGLFFW